MKNFIQSIVSTLIFAGMMYVLSTASRKIGYINGCEDTYNIIYKGLNLKTVDTKSLHEVCQARAK